MNDFQVITRVVQALFAVGIVTTIGLIFQFGHYVIVI